MQFIQVIVMRLLVAISATSGLTEALRFSSIQMPALVQRGANFWLACHFELAADEQLYSIKWYKNNEEFYRLLATSGSNLTNQEGAMEPDEPDEPDKQYFTQAGVNVLMSGSNATHVRLLNASLESEGAYACEISSENLSTIRYEREIKVYVLPHLKLGLIGLRTFYSLGERVELLCSSDLSRPAGALAWFINGQRITTNSRPLFELEAKQTTGGGGGPQQLAHVSLALKFTLTNELLVGGGNQSVAGARNQSWKLSSRFGRPLELLRLECRFKLTDVSDVTFSELKVAPPPPPPPPPHELSRPAKSRDGRQLVQTPAASEYSTGHDACQRGPLALQPDDPIILRAHESAEPDGAQQQQAATLNLNCSTLAAAAALGQQLEAPTSEVVAAGAVNVEPQLWPLGPARRKFATQTSAKLAPLCADPAARRRTLISAKYQTADEQQLSAPRGAKLRNNQPIVAYVRVPDEQARLLTAATAATTAADSAGAQVTKSLAQLEAPPRRAGRAAWQLRAPPLLEWFINNREAPKSSVSYSPELPLLSPSLEVGQWDKEPALLPSVDYAQYFANFDSARPLDQHLQLSLKLDKKHFQTADSQLTLRCTSTQAQVLLLDSASVSLLLAPREEEQQQQTHRQSAHWQQRPLAANNQIKPKYLHQQSRGSNQRLSVAPTSYSVPSVVRSCASPSQVAELPSLVLLCLSSSLLTHVISSGWSSHLR